jgi:hypothetical protein|tara:strand:+ start:216 stop:389 length:174 start_codon:yes stop_codon:yes gene_type:complete
MKVILATLVVTLSVLLAYQDNKVTKLEYKIEILECEIMHYEYDIKTGISCEEVALEE